RKAGQNRDCYQLCEPLVAGHVLRDRERDRGFAAGSAKVLDGGDAAEHVGEQDIQNGAESERSENSDRHVALRIPRFLCGGGNGIKADVSEEDNAGRTKNSEYSAIRVGNSLGGGVTRRRGN